MIVSEEEAKKKWCHRYPESEWFRTCEGSGCMAWRWEMEINYNHTAEDQKQGVSKWVKTGKGYCGLAGKPE